MRWGVCIALVLMLAACATAPTPVNRPLPPSEQTRIFRARDSDAGEDVLVLALSGGGARAAAFELGALQALRDMRGRDGRALTQHIALTTAVSGGAVLSAYYALYGEAGLDTFRGAYLDKSWRLNSYYAPTTWWSAWRGGANGPNRLAGWLNRELYNGARISDLQSGLGPRTIVNATDLHTATPFAFTPLFFRPLCSDPNDVRVADAVAASMAVPLVFRPVLVESYPDACESPPSQRWPWVQAMLSDRNAPEMLRATARAVRHYGDPGAERYVHLTDGGVADNFGLTTLSLMRVAEGAPWPFLPTEAVRARRILVLVVNAERLRSGAWQAEAHSPSGTEVLASTLDGATNAAMRSALDAFRASLPEMQRELVGYRCGLDAEERRGLGAGDGWRCDDLVVTMDVISYSDLDGDARRALVDAPTAVSLPRESVDALIAGGRGAVERNAAVASFAH